MELIANIPFPNPTFILFGIEQCSKHVFIRWMESFRLSCRSWSDTRTKYTSKYIFGPTVNAARGITVQVQNAIQGFATNFQTALNPQITKSYAAYNWDYTKFLLFLSSRVSIFLLFIISLPVLLETNQILTWWLDTPPDYTDKFIKIILLITMIDALANPIIVAAQATGKIKNIK